MHLWPLSRENHPKFLLDVTLQGHSLIQTTWDCLLSLCGPDHHGLAFVAGPAHVKSIHEQLSDLSPCNFFCEPDLSHWHHARRGTWLDLHLAYPTATADLVVSSRSCPGLSGRCHARQGAMLDLHLANMTATADAAVSSHPCPGLSGEETRESSPVSL
jgi:hypothetical protein